MIKFAFNFAVRRIVFSRRAQNADLRWILFICSEWDRSQRV